MLLAQAEKYDFVAAFHSSQVFPVQWMISIGHVLAHKTQIQVIWHQVIYKTKFKTIATIIWVNIR